MTTPTEPSLDQLTDSLGRRTRPDFPVLNHTSQSVVYLDNGATTQKPQCVIDRMTQFYQNDYGTVRRGVYALSARATQQYDAVRQQVAQFLNANSPNEIVFTRGTTESINLVAATYGRQHVQAGDNVVISALEHHANLVPWQQLCLEKQATLRVIPVDDSGALMLDTLDALIDERTRIVAVTQVSNALGTVTHLSPIIARAKHVGAVVLVDGAQGAPHMPIDVQAMGADFYVFSSHKCYGPTGIGVLWGRYDLLCAMPPYQYGGDMIVSVAFEASTFAKPPARFEAGTPAIAEAMGLGEALAYMTTVGLPTIAAHEQYLLQVATEKLQALPGLRILGTAPHKAAVISFVLDGIHPHDIGTLLDEQGIAVRAGHHCAQPVMTRYGVPATTRASFGLYNTLADVDALVNGLQYVFNVMR